MKISIITVVRNGAGTLRDCIESVLGQSHPDLEYIVIDGASTDGTLALLDEYRSRIACLISEPDRGIYDAMNKGIAAATGQVLGILNADDLYAHPHVLANVAAALQAETVDAAYGDLVFVDAADTRRVRRTWRAGAYRVGAFRYGWMLPHPTFFVKRRVYARYGDFNLSLRSAADYEFMLRVVHKHGIRLCYLPEVLVRMRVGGVSTASWRNRVRANAEDRQAWHLNELRPLFFTLWWKPMRKMLQFFDRRG